ncbi:MULTISPECIES: hypothetical protein [Aeromonas]|uniref:Uncharacterized protein n=1 Tax=Aeromonas veronii TaxID=654 RepID=A0A4S5CP43_AERVE|nr:MULTISPECIES: hypothetical protein [Aeromonas]THJ44956.1 hypothetical protein E8Q35_12260 [Aeromonas veronii]
MSEHQSAEQANTQPSLVSEQDQADRQAWDDALDNPLSETLLDALVNKGMQGPFDADQAGAAIDEVL